jgi:hypothetical protein
MSRTTFQPNVKTLFFDSPASEERIQSAIMCKNGNKCTDDDDDNNNNNNCTDNDHTALYVS